MRKSLRLVIATAILSLSALLAAVAVAIQYDAETNLAAVIGTSIASAALLAVGVFLLRFKRGRQSRDEPQEPKSSERNETKPKSWKLDLSFDEVHEFVGDQKAKHAVRKLAAAEKATLDSENFLSLKHVRGLPGVNQFERVAIALKQEGIIFLRGEENLDSILVIPWSRLEDVITDSAAWAETQRNSNAFITGGLARSQGAGVVVGALAGQILTSMLADSPLILEYRATRNDKFRSQIVFDTNSNKTISHNIHAFRAGLIAKGALEFEDEDAKTISPPSSNAAELIAQLGALRSAGHLSDEEFNVKKTEILLRI